MGQGQDPVSKLLHGFVLEFVLKWAVCSQFGAFLVLNTNSYLFSFLNIGGQYTTV